jgi:rhodanese-related sulfurtransferase
MANLAVTFIVDVRSRTEYEFIGHPDILNGVPNIPLLFYPGWKTNRDFVRKVEERYQKEDTLIMMCRSGKRAEFAAKILKDAGFENVIYMNDSFERPKDKNGHRTIGGWKVSGLPYTHKLDQNLVYK